MRTLERLGLAEPAGPARRVLAADTEPRLRALGERGDIIKRLHKSLAKDGASRAPSSWALEGERHGEPVIGRLADDEHTTREWLDWANCVEDRSAPGG